MKKSIAILAAALALATQAADQKIAYVQFADQTRIVKAATKLGEMAGFPMLGSLTAQALGENPLVEYFGKLSSTDAILVVVYEDDDMLSSGDMDKSDMEIAVICAPTRDKAAFLAANPGSLETNGVIKFREDPSDEDSDSYYAVYSEDGKWASFADETELALDAIKDVERAKAAMGESVAKLELLPAGRKFISASIAAAAKVESNEADKANLESLLPLVEQTESAELSLSVTEAGLNLSAWAGFVKDSPLAKAEPEPISGTPLAFAGENALLACEYGRLTPFCNRMDDQFKAISELTAKYGIKTDSFWKRAGEGTTYKFMLDLPAAVAYAKGEGKETFDKIDPETFVSDAQAIKMAGSKFDPSAVNQTPVRFSMELAGKTPALSPAARFAKVIPEAAAKKPFYASVMPVYATIKAILPLAMQLADDDAKSSLTLLLAALPENDSGAIATIAWKPDARHNLLSRISPEEIRGLTQLGTTACTYAMMTKTDVTAQPVAIDPDKDDDGDGDKDDNGKDED